MIMFTERIISITEIILFKIEKKIIREISRKISLHGIFLKCTSPEDMDIMTTENFTLLKVDVICKKGNAI